jgi:hypothetical protein
MEAVNVETYVTEAAKGAAAGVSADITRCDAAR